MSTYKVVGVSRFKGEVKVRFAQDMMYVKGLSKGGNTDIELVEAPTEMEKPALVEFLKTTSLYENTEYREAIDARAEMYAVKAGAAAKSVKSPKATTKVAKKTTKVTKAKVTKPSLDALKARAAKKVEAAAE